MDPLVSFVIPCYNYARFLPDCLNGIFGQEGGYSFEIIAVDDCSTDNTLDVLAQYRDSRMTILRHEKNQGHVKTVNEGLAAARGRFVARIDPDDRYRSCFLSTLLPKFEEYPDVALVYGDAAIVDSEGAVCVESTDRLHRGADFKGNELCPLLLDNFLCAPTAIARREAWLEAMPIPAHLAFNDWYFNLMIARKHDFCYVNRVVADYRVHASNHHATIVKDKSEEPSIRYLLDYIFSIHEEDPAQEARKRAFRSKAYAAQYLILANKYFGAGLTADARRCYLEAIRFLPSTVLSATAMRRFGATWLQPGAYEALKRAFRKGYSTHA
jgi:glycosyltransferase involved in cell wall biosynthesis